MKLQSNKMKMKHTIFTKKLQLFQKNINIAKMFFTIIYLIF